MELAVNSDKETSLHSNTMDSTIANSSTKQPSFP